MSQFLIQNYYLYFYFADINQAQFLLSGFKQLIKKQCCESAELQNKVDKLQMKKEMLLEKNVNLSCKTEMIEKEFRLRGIK